VNSPNFIFIGPSKTGSTWIFRLLKSHPQICVPKAKDIYFFDKFYHKGLNWYLKQFSECSNEKIVGELSHDYFSSTIAIKRIYRDFPEVKIICCLRNPFERSMSSADFIKRNGLAKGSIADISQKYPEVINESLYYRHLSYILNVFPKDNILILMFDVLKRNPEAFAKNIFKFLNIEVECPLTLIRTLINKRSKARIPMVALFVKKSAMIVRRLGYPNIVGRVKHNTLISKILYEEADNTIQYYERKNDIDFLAEYLIDDIEKLGYLVGTTFDDWIDFGK